MKMCTNPSTCHILFGEPEICLVEKPSTGCMQQLLETTSHLLQQPLNYFGSGSDVLRMPSRSCGPFARLGRIEPAAADMWEQD